METISALLALRYRNPPVAFPYKGPVKFLFGTSLKHCWTNGRVSGDLRQPWPYWSRDVTVTSKHGKATFIHDQFTDCPTVLQCRYDMVNTPPNISNRHAKPLPWGARYRVFLVRLKFFLCSTLVTVLLNIGVFFGRTTMGHDYNCAGPLQ